MVIDDSIHDASYSDWLIINTTSVPIHLQLGKEGKPLIIEGKGCEEYELTAPVGVGIPVFAKARFGRKERKFYSTYWAVRKNERSIIFFIDKSPRILVRRMSDALLPN